jgi:hypothetical protein
MCRPAEYIAFTKRISGSYIITKAAKARKTTARTSLKLQADTPSAARAGVDRTEIETAVSAAVGNTLLPPSLALVSTIRLNIFLCGRDGKNFLTDPITNVILLVKRRNNMTVIAIPKILREKLTDEGADALVNLLNEVGERSKDTTLEVAESSFEKRLAEEIGSVRVEIARTKSKLIRWMFIFWVGQVGTITAILFAFFQK